MGTSHNITNILIEGDGDHARAHCHCLAWHWFERPDIDGHPQFTQVTSWRSADMTTIFQGQPWAGGSLAADPFNMARV
jgi:hypothetical protein